jgi:Ca2+-binding RTX toxin-like protein
VCRNPDLGDPAVLAGGGDDVVTIRGDRDVTLMAAYGQAGDDRLVAAGADSELYGGHGRDVLVGGGYRDELFGGPGRDRLFGRWGPDELNGDAIDSEQERVRRGAADVLHGGSGEDVASWGERRTPVRVDLASGWSVGARGERDRLRALEGAIGGSAADRLSGTAGADELRGYDGADTIDGRAGHDLLDSGLESPMNSGMPDGDRDRILCGRGHDRVNDAGLGPLGPDCERLVASQRALPDRGLRAWPRPAGRGRLRFDVAGTSDDVPVRVRVVLRSRGRELGRSPLTRITEEVGTVVVRLRRPIRSGRLVHVRSEGPRGRGAFVYVLRP